MKNPVLHPPAPPLPHLRLIGPWVVDTWSYQIMHDENGRDNIAEYFAEYCCIAAATQQISNLVWLIEQNRREVFDIVCCSLTRSAAMSCIPPAVSLNRSVAMSCTLPVGD